MPGLEEYYEGRAGGLEGLEGGFYDRLTAMFAAMPDEVAAGLSISSAYRTEEHQQELYDDLGPSIAAKPGSSNHNFGRAMDIKFTQDVARKWFHANASNFGLAFPLGHEDWHIEPAGLRDGTYKPGADFDYVTADPEAYTDGDSYVPPNNHSMKTQLLRVADIIQGSGYAGSAGRRAIDPTKLAENNMRAGIGDLK